MNVVTACIINQQQFNLNCISSPVVWVPVQWQQMGPQTPTYC